MSTATVVARRWLFVVVAVIAAAAFAQEPAKGKKGKAPAARMPEGVKVLRDVEYVPNGGASRSLDLYVPDKADHPLPLVVWIHGGGWRGGTKAGGPFAPLLEKGYAVASVEYRLSGEATFPAQIFDCKAAVRFLRAHAKEHNIDAGRVGVWGGSAGGHLVALLGTSGDVKEVEGDEGVTGVSSRVQAVCDWFGPSDLLTAHQSPTTDKRNSPGSPVFLLLGGTLEEKEELARRASPVTFVTKDDPPFLIMHGDQDPLVPIAQSYELRDALTAARVPVDMVVVKGAGHGGPLFQTPEAIRTVIDFFDGTLKPKEGRAAAAPARPPAPAAKPLPAGVRAIRDVEYVPGGGRPQTLDVYLPEKPAKQPMPLVVWIHGGGWVAGDKANPPGLAMIARGYAMASINYRFSQEALFPAQIYDCKAAVRYLRSHAKEHGIDPNHFGVWGASAGGHLVALLGTTGDVKELEGDEGVTGVSSRVQCVCDWFGPANFLTFYDHPSIFKREDPNSLINRLFGGEPAVKKELATRASPVFFASKDDPPFLIMHGDKDNLVPVEQSRELDEALRKAGVEVTLTVVPGAGHGFGGPGVAKLARQIDEFFDTHLLARPAATAQPR